MSLSDARASGSHASIKVPEVTEAAAVAEADAQPDVEPIAIETVQRVETKGEKSFVIQTVSVSPLDNYVFNGFLAL